jgi:hypothetical protein
LKVELEETQIRCSQVTLLSAVLQQRVSDSEDELRALKCTAQVPVCSAMTPVILPGMCATENFRILLCLTIFCGPLDLDATMYSIDIPASTIPSSPSYRPDSPLPPLSSQSSNNSVDICDQLVCTFQDLHNADRTAYSSFSHHPQQISPSQDLTSPALTALPSSGSNADSMGWPPIESVLLPARENAQQDCETSVQVSEVLCVYRCTHVRGD